MASDAAKAVFPHLAKMETDAPRQQGKIPREISASECIYGKREVERKFYNPFKVSPADRVPTKPAKRR